MKKIITALFSIPLLLLPFFPSSVFGAATDNIANPQIYNQPVISWGNSSYHDLLGARDPYVVKDNGTYYLYYDCTENLYNPSFESNLGTNGWDTWHASVSSVTEKKLFGDRSLKVETDGTKGGGAYTGNYYYNNNRTDANLASPMGLLVTPNTTYIASAYFWANSNTEMGLVVKQYKSDPRNFAENVIDSPTTSVTKNGNNNWQRIFVKFTTAANASAVTISLATPQAARTTSYWDGVQLERITDNGVSTSSEFPTNMDFNRNVEETIGWKSCVATSTDGINFTKKGPLKVLGTKGSWEAKSETTGFPGTSFIYANVFPYNGKWYAYTWEAWHPIDVTHRYWDLATQLPNGDSSSNYPARSGLSMADSPLGPFTRISQSSPVVLPTDQNYCQQQTRSCQSGNMVWGCDYMTANGAPHLINNQWVLFLAGQTQYQNGVWAGSTGYQENGEAGCHAITSGFATSSSPLGPWTPWNQNPLFTPQDQATKVGTAEEGPIYYFDQGSGNHVLFYNAISGGIPRVDAFWTKDPLNHWPGENKAQIITQAGPFPWMKYNNPQSNVAINLPTVIESADNSKLLLYFGVRDGWEGNDPTGGTGYLFHDIGLATLKLPLLSASQSSPTASASTETPEYTTKYQVAYDNRPTTDTEWGPELDYIDNTRLSHTFSPAPGDKFVFVKFKTNQGKEVIHQLKVSLVSSASDVLPAPQNLQFQCSTPDGRSVTVSWNPVDGASNYLLRFNKQPFDDWKNDTAGDFGYAVNGNLNTTHRIAISPNSSYQWNVQPVKPGEKYPFKGQQAGKTFNCATTQTSDSSYPAASLKGPNSAVPGQSVTFDASINSSVAVGSSHIYIAKADGVLPTRVTGADISGFDIHKFNCDNSASSNCAWYEVGSSSSSSYSGSFTMNTEGNYAVIVDVQAASGQKACSGNFFVSYPISSGGWSWLNCGDKSAIYLGTSRP